MAIGYNHSVVLGTEGYVYSSGYNYYGTLGDGTNTDSKLPVRTGIREENVVIYDPNGTGTNDRADTTTLSNTPISYGDGGVTIDASNFYRKEYIGFNLRTSEDQSALLTGSNIQVEIFDPSLVAMSNNGDKYTFEAKQADRFGTTNIRFNFNYTQDGKQYTDTYLMRLLVKDNYETAESVRVVDTG